MPTSYRVFLGAPSIHDLANDPKTYSWRTTSSTSASNSKDAVVPARTQSSRGGISAKPSMSMNKSISRVESIQREHSTYAQIRLSQSFVLPKATLEEASRRISLIYRDLVLSGGGEEDEELGGGGVEEDEHEEDEDDSGASESGIFEARADTQDQDAPSEGEFIPGLDPTRSVEVSVFRGVEQTTLISWPPSNSRLRDADETRGSNNNSFAAPSFLLDNTTEQSRSRIGTGDASNLNRTSQFTGSQSQTQALESQSFGAYSDASSIGRFPSFHFSLHALMPLAVLINMQSNQNPNQNHLNAPKQNAGAAGWHGPGGPAHGQRKPSGPARKVNLLLAVLEVDGPDTIRLKKGADAGTQVSVLKLILGDEAGNVARLMAWRETAEQWGGMNGKVEVKRGDIVHIENVNAAYDSASGATMTTLSASPFLKSKLVVCYRTMPATPQDARLRPDLRLGISEPSVRRVAGIVEWFEQMAGIA